MVRIPTPLELGIPNRSIQDVYESTVKLTVLQDAIHCIPVIS